MENQKIENLLNVSLQATISEREKSMELDTGVDIITGKWELLVKYTGDITKLRSKYDLEIINLYNSYAILNVEKEKIEPLSEESSIIFIEKPKKLYFQKNPQWVGTSRKYLLKASGIVYNSEFLTGRDVIVGIIDTGINAENPEFRNEDGSTRILNIYDQDTKEEYSRSEINEILEKEQYLQDDVRLMGGRDFNGHGTDVAVIAAGNSGVAGKSDIIAVKLGIVKGDAYPRTTFLCEAVDYIVRKASEYNKPAVINISYGSNYGDHFGNTLVENYIDAVAQSYKCLICVGSGNEGLGRSHYSGRLESGESLDVELSVDEFQTGFDLQIWKQFQDYFVVEIEGPDGAIAGRIENANVVIRSSYRDTELMMYYGEPSPYNINQEIYINFLPERSYVTSGVWKVRIISDRISDGRFDMWLPVREALSEKTGFTEPDSNNTFTIPSCARRVVTVGAYDAKRLEYAPFSGKGRIVGNDRFGDYVKPELSAPGVEVGKASVTGTSFAVPFVTGKAACLMEWGLVMNNDRFLYGDKLKALLIKQAAESRVTDILSAGESLPLNTIGWGGISV